MARTTKKHFKLFKDECEKYIIKFGLTDWTVCYKHLEMEDRYACLNAQILGRVATIFFNKIWESNDITPLTNNEVKLTAKHECIHLLLAELSRMAASRYVTQDELLMAEESIVVRLIGLI